MTQCPGQYKAQISSPSATSVMHGGFRPDHTNALRGVKITGNDKLHSYPPA